MTRDCFLQNTFVQNLFQRTIQRILPFFNEICKPNPNFISAHPKKNLHTRNKIVILLLCVSSFFYILDIINGKVQILSAIAGTLVGLAILIIILISFRFHPEIFNVFFNFLVSLYGPYLAYTQQGGIQASWIGIQTFPYLVYLVTGSYWHFIVQNSFQILYLNTIYKVPMERELDFSSPRDFVNNFSHALLTKVIIYSIIFSIARYYGQRFNYKTKEKKKDFEKQKTFVLSFSHELRNVINSLLGNINLAQAENVSTKAKDFLESAQTCGEVLLHLVNNILDSGKSEIGELDLNLRPTNIYDSLEKIWEVGAKIINRKNLQGRMSIEKSIPKLLNTDHQRVMQVLLNLIDNAVKFTERGYIDIHVTWLNDKQRVEPECFEPHPFNVENEMEEGIFEKSIALSVFDQNSLILTPTSRKIDKSKLFPCRSNNRGVLKISVLDTGCGIKSEDFYRLYKKFFRLESNTPGRRLGTGLGLFVSKELCIRMGGDLQVFSEYGKGTCFTFCLPVEPVQNNTTDFLLNEESVSVLKSMSNKPLKAMIVDDVLFNQSVMAVFFDKMDIEIKTAHDGLDAYERFKDHVEREDYIDIITMDLEMPVMDGKTSIAKIRELEAERGLAPCLIIIVSGNCSQSEMTECLDPVGKLRANAFLKKPVLFEELQTIIRTHFAYD